MADIEKVIKAVDNCIHYGCKQCTYYDNGCEKNAMLADVLELLKEQDAKEHISDDIHETAKQFRQTIVRCKDCRHYENCEVNDLLLNHENGYCSDGERNE